MDTPPDCFCLRASSIPSLLTHNKEAERVRKMLENLDKEWAKHAAWSKVKKAKSWYKKKPKDISSNELKDYVETLLYKFTKDKQSDKNLIEYFWEPDSFREFSINDFKRLSSPLQFKLRKYLRCGGVYVLSGDLS